MEEQHQEHHLVPKDINLPAERMQTAKGLGHIDEEDRIIPRLKIMQPLSPEVDEGLAKPGEFVNSIAKKSFGKSIAFVPIFWWKSRVYWQKREEGGGILCQARDALTGNVYGICADCDFSKWHDKEAPICTAIINILGIANGELVCAGFMKTSYGTGKQLINLFAYKGVDIYNFEYELYNKQEENDFGKFWVANFKDTNKATEDKVYKLCSSVYNNFVKIKEKVEDIHTAE